MKRLAILAAFACATACVAAPDGYVLVADDDCGNDGCEPHLAVGSDYTWSASRLKGSETERTCAFDNRAVVMRYISLNPQARYRLEILYASEAKRVQRLEAAGKPIHDALELPTGAAKTFFFDLPNRAYKDGKLELRFIRVAGANAVVSRVRVWSTDRRKLGSPVGPRGIAWEAEDPIEVDWSRQDAIRGWPMFDWKDPKQEIEKQAKPAIRDLLGRGAKMLADFRRTSQGQAAKDRSLGQSERALGEIARRLAAMRADSSRNAWKKLYLDAHWAVRRLAFKNPLIDFNQLLFVRRHHAHYMHQCARRLAAATKPGGGICILDGLQPDSPVREITKGVLPCGAFTRPDLSFDAKHIIFGYGAEDPQGVNFSESAALRKTGFCEDAQVYEMALDGSGLRKLTEGPFENTDPIYLPNGRIAFMSHRAGGLVQCGDWARVYCVFTMNADGSDVRQITLSKDGEWDPTLLDDGRVLFNRWEYMMKFWRPIQFLWAVRPDGTDPQLVYGNDLSQKKLYPLNFALPRQIPGTSKIVCIGSAHHNTGAGPVCVLDLNYGRDRAKGLERITPVRYVETQERMPHAGWYDCPYGLSENYFLVSYSFQVSERATRSYGIYLLDRYGGKELIYRDAKLSALFPIPVKPRLKPPAIPSIQEKQPGAGAFLVIDVHEGLPEAARGKARYLRVCEAIERKIHTKPYNIQVGPDSGFETKRVLGTVALAKDGSAHFTVPAGVSVFFHVLDKDHLSLHVMRAVTNVQAGETTSCIGCHEPMSNATPNRMPLAARSPAKPLTPPPWGTDTLGFERHVQPILDKHCTRCHDGSKAKGKSFDLTARAKRRFMTVPMSQSYFNLRRYIKHAPIYTYSLPPMSFGSGQSKLMQVLNKGHYDVKLAPAEWRLLAAWIDCNAPYIDRYEVVAVRK